MYFLILNRLAEDHERVTEGRTDRQTEWSSPIARSNVVKRTLKT